MTTNSPTQAGTVASTFLLWGQAHTTDPHTAINKSSGCVFSNRSIGTPILVPTSELSLLAYPNPSNGMVHVQFSLPQTESAVNLSIFDLQGRLISTLFEGNEVASSVYQFDTQIAALTAGMYIALLTTTHGQKSTKIAVVK